MRLSSKIIPIIHRRKQIQRSQLTCLRVQSSKWWNQLWQSDSRAHTLSHHIYCFPKLSAKGPLALTFYVFHSQNQKLFLGNKVFIIMDLPLLQTLSLVILGFSQFSWGQSSESPIWPHSYFLHRCSHSHKRQSIIVVKK